MGAIEKEKNINNIFLSKTNEVALKNPLVAVILGRTPKSPEEILKSSGIDTVK
ncbi:MAG: hypothetical protein NTU58_00695 [Candidatus Nealsonbacteria bacterium]|nr:hypothetical protein [Candidatus Nealsonbacteria bacterium]